MSRGRIVLITGATRGLGRVMSAEFARLGHTVLGCGRSAAEIERLGRQLPEPHFFSCVDIAKDQDVKSWAGKLLASHGPPDLLLNNAGLMNRPAPLWKLDAGEFDEVIDVNLKGAANVIRHFAPAMVARGRGVFVNFSSGWGRSTNAEVAPYCASKWAIEGLTQAFSQELPPGMAAVALNPGIINTDMLRKCWADGAAAYPSPGEWAEIAVPYLLTLRPSDNGLQATVPIRCATD